MSGAVPDPAVISDPAWLERAEKRARRCVRNSYAYPCLAAPYVEALVAEIDRLRRLVADALAAQGQADEQRDAVLAELASSVNAGLQHVSITAVRRALGVTE